MSSMSADRTAPDPVVDVRPARREDLPAIVAMLSEDAIGDETPPTEPLAPAYDAAFRAIDADPRNLLLVAEVDGDVAGTCQVTFIPYLTHGASERALVEAVRVAAPHRSKGVGRRMMERVIDESRRRSCLIVQLTTNRQRLRARAFYERLGFVASHNGMKLRLESHTPEPRM